jgi:disulfide oxidoreductase YuzD
MGNIMSNGTKIKWLSEPEEKDYPAANSYLSLLYKNQQVEDIVAKLRKHPITNFKAKDIFRASGLSLLGVSNYHVEKDRKNIQDGKSLSPILLVRDQQRGKVIIADGYHRLCAVYSFNEDELIPCKIV